MQDRRKLNLNILFWVIVLTIFQILVFEGLSLRYGFPPKTRFFFALASVGIHGFLFMVLMLLRFAFVNLHSGEKLTSINLPNLLTMIRISATPTILFLLFLNRDYPVLIPLIIYTAGAFITDFLDGNISRRTKQVTKIGAYLDSISDYGVLIAISIAYIHFRLVSIVFFLLVIVRLLSQWIGMAILTVVGGKWADHKSSLLGKASIFTIMVVYALALLKLIPASQNFVRPWFLYLEAAAAVVVIISLLEKLGLLVVDIRKARRERREQQKSREEI